MYLTLDGVAVCFIQNNALRFFAGNSLVHAVHLLLFLCTFHLFLRYFFDVMHDCSILSTSLYNELELCGFN
jgi:hypothetical protein